MDELIARTTVAVPPSEAFDFLRDFPGYAAYSEYLERVDQSGDGGVGTVYAIHLSWWRIEYVAHTEVTAIEPPNRLEWTVTADLDAHGAWIVEPVKNGDESQVTLEIRYDTDSASVDGIDIPWFVSVGWIVRRVTPLLEGEATAVVERIVADLEGEPREVELSITHRSSGATRRDR